MGVVRLADFTGNPEQYESARTSGAGASVQLEALRQALSNAEHSSAEREQRASEAVDRVREVADYLRASDERIGDLQAGLEAIRERACRDIQAAQERCEQAEARVGAEAARADAAEARAREAEERLGEIMAVIELELRAGRAA
jgi:ABC-type transporter Mla subunit MlaD